jgi:hypothetical protein
VYDICAVFLDQTKVCGGVLDVSKFYKIRQPAVKNDSTSIKSRGTRATKVAIFAFIYDENCTTDFPQSQSIGKLDKLLKKKKEYAL